MFEVLKRLSRARVKPSSITTERILKIATDRPVKPAELAEILGVSRERARKKLYKLYKKGLLERDETGYYHRGTSPSKPKPESSQHRSKAAIETMIDISSIDKLQPEGVIEEKELIDIRYHPEKNVVLMRKAGRLYIFEKAKLAILKVDDAGTAV